MSGSLLKQASMETCELGRQPSGSASGSSNNRNFNNGHGRESALQLFVQAKRRINEIFKDLRDYVGEACTFIEGVLENNPKAGEEIVSAENAEAVAGFIEKIDGIREVLARDHMKVVFFGRTSNGKSTVINAMLREKILPSGIGHTTNCFIQVEGCDDKEASLLTEDSDVPKNIQSVKELASALSTAKLKENSLIRILWPKSKCRLLGEDIVFLDSPGIDVSPDLDSWIDKFCLDADVFVLVANAESTLMQTEKNFFHKVSARLSKPNIFVLQNRWDVSEMEDDIDKVKQQHIDYNTDFLADQLQVVERREAKDRLFFVSAREALVSRLHNDTGVPTPEKPDRVLLPGFQARLFEFDNFENKFEVCISKSAVKTKFKQHTDRAKVIITQLRAIMDLILAASVELHRRQHRVQRERTHELDFLSKQLDLLTQEVKEKVKGMVDDVEKKVACALNDEIRRLAALVDEFERPFHPDPMLLNVYKKEMHAFIEQTLGRNLQARCSAALLHAVESTEKHMTDRLSSILPENTRQQLFSLIPKRDFEIAYRLDCRNLCSEFREDIEFKFSYSPTAILQKLLGSKKSATFLVGTAGSLGQPSPGSTAPAQPPALPSLPSNDQQILTTLLTTFASFTSRTTLGALTIAGLVAKTAGWRVIAITGGLYGLLYMYERLTWTTRAKERCFKQQYVEYASSKLRLIVDLTSSNCSHQVQQELSSTFARLCHHADMTKQRMAQEMEQLAAEIDRLEEITSSAKMMRNKADFLDTDLHAFCAHFLEEATSTAV